ncbi:MAG: putative quinol monooxygenase [Acidimicrobiales bacterium]
MEQLGAAAGSSRPYLVAAPSLPPMHIVVAHYRARAGAGDQVADAIRAHVAASRAEPGCRMFLVNRSTEDPDRFVLYEQYDDVTAFDAHRDSEHFRTILVPMVLPLLAERDFASYTLVDP